MKTIDFQQKTVVVTGGTGGMGHAVVKGLLQANAKVAAIYRSDKAKDELTQAMAGLGTIEFCQLDPGDTDAIGPCVDAIVAKMGPIAGLVQCAGLMAATPGLELEPGEWDRLMDVNAKGTFFLMQAVVGKSMKDHGGSVVNIASMAGIRGMVPPLQAPHYSASKAAVVSITMQGAVEWAPLGVRVNAIAPGGVKTRPMPKEELPPEMVANIPTKDFTEAGCVADTVLYLLSDMSCSMTGQCLVLDGGASVCGY